MSMKMQLVLFHLQKRWPINISTCPKSSKSPERWNHCPTHPRRRERVRLYLCRETLMAVECVSASFAMQHFNFITPKISKNSNESVPRLSRSMPLEVKVSLRSTRSISEVDFPKLMRLIWHRIPPSATL